MVIEPIRLPAGAALDRFRVANVESEGEGEDEDVKVEANLTGLWLFADTGAPPDPHADCCVRGGGDVVSVDGVSVTAVGLLPVDAGVLREE